jgi:hypothetical protein
LTTQDGRAILPVTLLNLTTKLPRLALPILASLIWAPAAGAWSWPVQGPVLRPFAYDEAHPYAAGQHRGIDIGADAVGDTVEAPASGVVTFAGTVPTNGESVTIETADGYAVTLTHLGSIEIAKGASVNERDPVGTVGPSGTAEVSSPYLHLGIRVVADSNGYVDPLGLLSPPVESGPTNSGSTSSQPVPSSGASTAPAAAPTTVTASAPTSSSQPATPTVADTSGPTVASHHSTDASRSTKPAVHPHEHAHGSRSETRPVSSSQRSAAPRTRAPHRSVPSQRRARSRVTPEAGAVQRPVVKTAAPAEPSVLRVGHEPRSSEHVAQPVSSPRAPSGPLLGLACNGAAALVALGAALAAARRRRHRGKTDLPTVAEVLQLPPRAVEQRRAA